MPADPKEKALIQKIRELAGQIGQLEKMELPGAPDAKEYCFQVRCGLSSAVVEILDYEPAAISQFHRYLLSSFVDPDNPRIAALLDALDNEIENQLATADDSQESE